MLTLTTSKPSAGFLAGASFYLLVFLAFFPALSAGFVWDDQGAILENPYIQSPTGLYSIWFTDRLIDYWPLTYSLFWAEWQLFGNNPGAFHVVNLLLHATAALVLWRVFRRLAVPGAFLIAAAFAVHPVAVASAAWIVEGKNTLSLLFGGLALLCWLRFDDADGRKWYWLSLGAFALALFAKTSLVTLPFVMLLIAWWRRSRIDRRDVARVIPFLALSLVLGLVTITFQNAHAIHNETLPARDFFSRIAETGWVVSFYWLKDLLPAKLSIFYPNWNIDARAVFAWLPLAALAVIAAAAWRRRAGWGRPVLFAGAVFAVLLLPVTGLIDMAFHRFSLVADHLQYAAIIVPLALVIGAGAGWLRAQRTPAWTAPALGCALVGVLSLLTWKQAAVYRSDATFWTHVVKSNPDAWVAHYNLGRMASEAGANGLARPFFVRALELNENHARSHNSLGAILAGQGHALEAEMHIRRALALRPDLPEAHYNLGLLLAHRDKIDVAIDCFQQAVRLDPQYKEAFDSLGVARSVQGDHRAAAGYFRHAIDLDPKFIKPYVGLGGALAELGEFDESLAAFRLAVQTDPENARARFSLGSNLIEQDKPLEAIPHLAAAVQAHPDNADGRFQLGRALAESGDEPRAIVQLAEAVRLQPDFQEAERLLAKLENGGPRE